jgi:flavin reductase (DIM6/NTAB) family NADH-FMN oxidoreductase RutF
MNFTSQSYSETDFANFEKQFRVNFFNGLLGFRATFLVGTQDAYKHANLAIFSSVLHVGSNPACYGILFRPAKVERHTLENILANKHFTLNHIHSEIYQKAHQTSAKYPLETSEFAATGLTEWHSDKLNAPYVAESHIKIGLELVEQHPIAFNETIFVVGKVIETFVPKEIIEADGFVNLEMANSLTTSGLDTYYETKKLERLAYARA